MTKQELINKINEFILKHSDDVDLLFAVYDSKMDLSEDNRDSFDEEDYFFNDGHKESMFADWYVDWYHDSIFHIKLEDQEVWLWLADMNEMEFALQFLKENNLERVEENNG